MLDFPSVPVAPCADYPTIRKSIEFISTRWRDQPSIEAIADHVGLSASHFQHVFKRWAGLTPKAFLQAITIERARELLRDSATVLDAEALSPHWIVTVWETSGLGSTTTPESVTVPFTSTVDWLSLTPVKEGAC